MHHEFDRASAEPRTCLERAALGPVLGRQGRQFMPQSVLLLLHGRHPFSASDELPPHVAIPPQGRREHPRQGEPQRHGVEGSAFSEKGLRECPLAMGTRCNLRQQDPVQLSAANFNR